jgi:hypothetical protein
MLSALSDAEADFLIVGAHALAAHGYVRATGDLDIWIRADAENAARVWRGLLEFGAPLDNLQQHELTLPDLIYQIGVPPNRIDILTSISGVEFDTAWDNRIDIRIESLEVPVLGRTDLIENKRAAGRPQDLADVNHLTKLPKPTTS